MPSRREIVLARFPFTDGSGAKLRPVLVLAPVPGNHTDYLVMFISSQVSQATVGVDFILQPGDSAFALSGLKMASVFRLGKIATLSSALIAGPLGRLDQPTFDKLVQRLVALLQEGHL